MNLDDGGLTHYYAVEAAERRHKASRNILVGGIMLGVGLLVTIGTYGSASTSSDGTYIVAYGPMIFGAIRLFRGLLG
jgi:uncharacterized membrane protein YiaA